VISLVAVGYSLVTLYAVSDEAFEVFRIFDTLYEAFSQEALQVPKSLRIADETQPMLLEEVAESSQIVLEAVIVEITPYMELPQVPHIAQHLHELQILYELAIQLICLLSVVGRHFSLFALDRLAFLLELVRLGLRHCDYYYF
jgi:hypothetical protein